MIKMLACFLSCDKVVGGINIKSIFISMVGDSGYQYSEDFLLYIISYIHVYILAIQYNKNTQCYVKHTYLVIS